MLNSADEEQAALNAFVRKIKDEMNGQLPCKITEVNADGSVDCLVIRNDTEKDVVFPNVPIRHLETTRAFVYLGVVRGDKGVIRFFDRSVENYKISGSQEYNQDDRQHSMSDGLFDYGFYPSDEAYAFPKDKTIAVGNKNGTFLLTVGDNGQLICTAASYEFNGKAKFNGDVEFSKNITVKENVTVQKNVEVTGTVHAVDTIKSDKDVIFGNLTGLTHKHGNGNAGQDTTTPK